jgi:hypothetical protein
MFHRSGGSHTFESRFNTEAFPLDLDLQLCHLEMELVRRRYLPQGLSWGLKEDKKNLKPCLGKGSLKAQHWL